MNSPASAVRLANKVTNPVVLQKAGNFTQRLLTMS
jgi:hypothetical protein